jgi:surface antigen
MKPLAAIALAAAAAAAAPAATAQNWVGLLKNTPAERFDEEDLRLFMDAARKALDEAPEKQPLVWENPRTRARGELTVLRSFESKGRACKDLRVRNEVPGRKGDTRLSFCSVDGKWRLLSAAQKK